MNRYTQSLGSYSVVITIAVIIISTYSVYAPGLSGGFVFDDTSNITANPMVAMSEFSWTDVKRAAFSMEGRPISRASFGLNHLINGFDPRSFKVVNLIIHILNGILVYMLFRKIARVLHRDPETEAYPIELFAALAGIAWVLHPVNLTNVLYVVQRMNSLSGLFIICGMLLYLHGRDMLSTNLRAGVILMLSAVLICTPLAYYSKQNGLLLPGFLFVIEATLFRFQSVHKSDRRFVFGYFLIFLLIPAIAATIYILDHPNRFLGGYVNRYFSLEERLLTETRVIWQYIKMIVLPFPGDFGLFLDDIALSKSWITPVTTLISALSLVGLLIISLLSIKRLPILSFGLLLFLSGHVMESTFIPLEIAFEHRNYIPAIGLIGIMFYFLVSPRSNVLLSSTMRSFSVVLVALLAMMTYMRANDWSSNISLFLTEVHHHPTSPRANYETGKLYGQLIEAGSIDKEEHLAKAKRYFLAATEARYNFTSGLFGLVLATKDIGNPIDAKWIDELVYRLEFTPYEKVNLLWLNSFTKCVLNKKCTANEIHIEDLFTASLKNKTLKIREKSILYMLYSNYKYHALNDISDAIHYATKATNSDPGNLTYRLRLVELLINNKQYMNASNILNDLILRDTNNLHTQKINYLSDLLKHYLPKHKS